MDENIFFITHWAEHAIANQPGHRRAEVRKEYRGVVSGSATVTYDLVYSDDGSARFTGEEWLEGSIAGQQGRWRFAHRGSFVDGVFIDDAELVGGPDASVGGILRSAGRHAEHYAYRFDPRAGT